MKKLIVLASLLLCMLLAACGAGGKETTADDATKSTKAKSESSTAATGESTPAAAESTTAPEESTTAPEETTPEATEPAFVPKGKVEIEPIQVPSGNTLKDLGPMEEGEGKLYFLSSILIRYEVSEDNTNLLIPVDHMGKAISSERYGNIDALSPGLFVVSSFEETINCSGLLAESGELLIPCEAAIIKELRPRNSSDAAPARFLLVVYGTEKTDNKDEAFFYATEAWFSVAPEEGDQFYKGYAKIYDLENHRFVPDVTVTNANSYDTNVCGNLIFLETADGTQLIYNADGKELFKSSVSYGWDYGNGFYVLDSKEVYDSEGELLFKVSGRDYLNVIKGSAQFLEYYNAETKIRSVYDFYGNKLFDLAEGIGSVSSEAGGLFACRLDKTAMLYNAQGELVYSLENSYPPSYAGFGIWEIMSAESGAPYTYFLVDGRTTSGKPYNFINEVKEEQSGIFSFYPWNNLTEKISFEWSYANKIKNGLVYNAMKPGQLVDAFSGEVLLEADKINYVNGYIYAQIDGVYHVYEPILE